MIETSKLTFGTLQGTGFKSVNGNEIPQFIDKLVDSEHPNDECINWESKIWATFNLARSYLKYRGLTTESTSAEDKKEALGQAIIFGRMQQCSIPASNSFRRCCGRILPILTAIVP